MTEQERKAAIEKLEDLRKQGVLSDDEYIEKVSQLTVEKEDKTDEMRPTNKGKGLIVVYIFVAVMAFVVLFSFFYGRNGTPIFRSNQSTEKTSENTKILSSKTKDNATSTAAPKRSYPYGVPAAGYTDRGSSFNAKDKELAMMFAQVYVKRQLKSPSTAKFPSSIDSYTYKREGNEWAVAGWVDATNSYGATIRVTWVSSFKITWENGKYNGEEVGTYIVE
jgi:hypothetical protein